MAALSTSVLAELDERALRELTSQIPLLKTRLEKATRMVAIDN